MPETPPPPPGDSDPGATGAFDAPATRAIALEPPAGERLGNHLILGVLGQGGMGVVYEAIDTLLGRRVAIKRLADGLVGEGASERFFQEARAAARLAHPNVVAIYEMGESRGGCYLVLEYVEGGSLADALKAGPLPWAEATRLVADACRGLAAAHDSGLVHRDIKPANILRTRGGSAKLTDFGLAKLAEGQAASLTGAGRVIGTPAYMSPEQCQAAPLDHRTDLYSLGATYYSLLTGQGPYGDSTSMPQLMFAHCYKPVPDPRQAVPDLPEGCAAIIRRSMAKEREGRYPTALAMLADLEALLAGRGTSTRPTVEACTPPPSPPPTCPQTSAASPPSLSRPPAPAVHALTRRAWLAAAGCGLAAAGGGLFAFGLGRRAGPPGARPVPSTASGPGPIRLGLLHSLSGFMAQSEATVLDGATLAIEEINRAGGLLGRRVEPVVADGQSDPEVFDREAERLITVEHVSALIGCWTSSSRKAVKEVVERYEHLLIYPLQHEGLEESPNVVYLGAVPNQQVLPAVKWCFTDLGRTFFLVGSDYVFPRVVAEIIRDELKRLGGEVVGECHLPLGTTVVADAVQAIKAARPAVVLNMINGDTNIPFFRELRDAGITPDVVPTMSFSLAENEVRALGPRRMAGDFASWSYFESLDGPANRDFVTRFHDQFGPQRQTSGPTETAYIGVHLWARAVAAAGRDDPASVRSALLGLRFDAPEGDVLIDPDNGHAWKTARLGRIQPDGSFDVFWSSSKPLRPLPFPPSRPRADWESLLADLHRRWGGKWHGPTG